MKICFIAPFGLKTKGTTSGRILPMAEALVERGHQVRVIVPPWDDPPGSPDLFLKKARLEVQNGVEIEIVPVGPKPSVLSLPVRLASSANRFQPEIIHVFKPKAYSGLAALLLSLRHRPFLLDTDDWEGPGGWNSRNAYSANQRRLFAWQERDLPRRATAVTVVSRTLQTQIWGFGVPPEKVCYLPNGVSRQKYADWSGPKVDHAAKQWRTRLNLNDKIVLLAYTRFAEFEPARFFGIAQATLARLAPEEAEKVRLLIVGGGFYREEDKLKEMAAPFGLADKVVSAGFAAWKDLPGLLRTADLALYPFDDNLINRARCSVKFLELMIAERPLISEAVGEIGEYLRDGQSNLLVSPGDTQAFAAAAARLLQLSPEARQNIGQQAATHLWQNYNWSKLIEPLEEIYKKVSSIKYQVSSIK